MRFDLWNFWSSHYCCIMALMDSLRLWLSSLSSINELWYILPRVKCTWVDKFPNFNNTAHLCMWPICWIWTHRFQWEAITSHLTQSYCWITEHWSVWRVNWLKKSTTTDKFLVRFEIILSHANLLVTYCWLLALWSILKNLNSPSNSL